MKSEKTFKINEKSQGSNSKDIFLSSDEMSLKEYPPKHTLKIAITVNVIATTLGMTSLGLLAMLIAHHALKEKEVPSGIIVLSDIIAFFTAIFGKIAIILFFNNPKLINKLKQLYVKRFRNFFNLGKKTILERFGWAINYMLSLNATLFWVGLVQISFQKSADLLDNLNSETAHNAGDHIRQWYVFVVFMVCSFYANWFMWPGVHQSGYQQMKSLLRWSLENRDYRRLKANISDQMKEAHQEILKELKACINSKKVEMVTTLRLDVLMQSLSKNNLEQSSDYPKTVLDKLKYVVNEISVQEPNQLRSAYLANNSTQFKSMSNTEWCVRHAVATVLTGFCAWGFSNILGLTDVVWAQWGAPCVSTYGARYAAYYSTIQIITLTVYPLIYDLIGMVKHGVPSHAFSNYALGFIFFMVGFVGIFGGLTNAEQSYLDNESLFSIINSVYASFAIESFTIYMILRTFFENRVVESKRVDDITLMKQYYLKLQALSQSADDTNLMTEKKFFDLAAKRSNFNSSLVNNEMETQQELVSTVRSEHQPLFGKFRMFCCFENSLRYLFNKEPSSNTDLKVNF